MLNLALLLLVVLLGLLAIYEPGLEEAPDTPPLLDLAREEIGQITIRRQGQEDVELKRAADGSWQLLQPLQVAASDYRIDSLLRITGTKSLASFPADSERLAQYHLEQPKVTLVLNNDTEIHFGDSTPLDHRRYVLLGNRVHLISDTHYYHLVGEYTTYIRPQPLPEGASITALHLPELSLAWRDERWQLEPAPETYSADQITRLLDAWRYASAIQVKRYDGKGGEAISVQLKGMEEPLNFLLSARSPDLVLARPDLQIEYHFPEASAEELLALPAATRDEGEPDRVD